jgi:uncharacterized protein (TIGR03435 family)
VEDLRSGGGSLKGTGVTMTQLASGTALSNGGTVTSSIELVLSGTFDVNLTWERRNALSPTTTSAEERGVTSSSAIQEQLGLRLVSITTSDRGHRG